MPWVNYSNWKQNKNFFTYNMASLRPNNRDTKKASTGQYDYKQPQTTAP
jgi:hypothetical protein